MGYCTRILNAPSYKNRKDVVQDAESRRLLVNVETMTYLCMRTLKVAVFCKYRSDDVPLYEDTESRRLLVNIETMTYLCMRILKVAIF